MGQIELIKKTFVFNRTVSKKEKKKKDSKKQF